MSAVQQPPLPPPDVVAPGAAPTELKPRRGIRPPVSSPIAETRTTPAFLRQWNVILLVLIGAFAVVGSIASLVMRSASETTANNTAPALIGIQDLFASVAEANAAATAAFLSTSATGTEDRVNRNLYLDAIRRASGQSEEVSAIIGSNDEAHEALKDIAVSLNIYSGRIEAARVANSNDLPGADVQLREALGIVQTDVATAVATVNVQGQDQLDAERTTGRILAIAAVGIGVLTLLGLFWLQVGLLNRTNRILNPLLVIATLLVATVLGYLVIGPANRALALNQATDGGYDAIATTSEIQTTAFSLQSQLSLQILDSASGAGASGEDLEPLFADVATRIGDLAAGADSDRERAAAETLQIRWARYEAAARDIQTEADRGNQDAAVELFQGDGLATFNGLNTAIESVLSDNRSQFLDGVDDASRAVSTTPFLTIVLPVLAALATLLAIQRRLGEYR